MKSSCAWDIRGCTAVTFHRTDGAGTARSKTKLEERGPGLWGANAAPVRRREWRKGQRSKLLAWLWNCLRNLFRGTD